MPGAFSHEIPASPCTDTEYPNNSTSENCQCALSSSPVPTLMKKYTDQYRVLTQISTGFCHRPLLLHKTYPVLHFLVLDHFSSRRPPHCTGIWSVCIPFLPVFHPPSFPKTPPTALFHWRETHNLAFLCSHRWSQGASHRALMVSISQRNSRSALLHQGSSNPLWGSSWDPAPQHHMKI